MFGARRLLNLRKLSSSRQEELRSDVSKAVEVSNEAEVAIRGSTRDLSNTLALNPVVLEAGKKPNVAT
ncbi:hypothetical protein DY000_02037833 [Brassica cretica]|uniref:Uncharacterized protein n=1 Tax=Brassica cretica TaxID=69181 RepID=A0ABQ7B4B4_BRACR|nr:hypothetical protein DY000_02037833 [Brassica cretica]